MQSIAEECKGILTKEGINLSSSVDYDVNGEVHSLTLEWIIDTYMQASEESHQVFLDALKLSFKSKEMGVDKFFENMGQLVLMTHFSDKIAV